MSDADSGGVSGGRDYGIQAGRLERRDMHRASTSLMEELKDYLFTEAPIAHS